MTKLSFVEEEVRRVLRRRSPHRLQRLQDDLVALCEAHWQEVRGPEPQTGLARAAWEVRPPLATLLIRLYGAADPRLADVLGPFKPIQALALITRAEIARGNADGARMAYDAMMLFESAGGRDACTRAALAEPGSRGESPAPQPGHRHPLLRAITTIAARIARDDPDAVLAAIGAIAHAQARPDECRDDPELQSVLRAMADLGVEFRALQAGRLRYALRGQERPPVPVKRLADMLAQARQARA